MSDQMTARVKKVLQDSKDQIERLRRVNNDMRVRLTAFDDMIACFDKRLPRQHDTDMTNHLMRDVMWDIDGLLSEVDQ